MAEITIDGVTLQFSESAFTAAQWEQVASWVLNGGGEAAAENAQIALKMAEQAAKSEANADEDANSAKSYAVGGTGTREGEDTDNAKFYCQQAHAIAGEGMVFSVNGVQADDVGNVAVTKENIGLDKVNNTSDTEKPVSLAQQQALDQKAAAATHNIVTYTSLSQLGLSDDDMSDTDFTANIDKLYTALPTGAIFISGWGAGSNVTKSISAKLNDDIGGFSASGYQCGFEIRKLYNVSIPSIVNVVVDTTKFRGNIYTCIFDKTSGTAFCSKFAESYNETGTTNVETGAWTPIFAEGTLFTATEATFSKIGRRVYASAKIYMNSTAEDAVVGFSGLPYIPAGSNIGHFYTNYTSGKPSNMCDHVIVNTSTSCSCVKSGASYDDRMVTVADIGAKNNLRVYLKYETES